MLWNDIYLVSNSCFLTEYTQVSSLPLRLYPPTIRNANWARRGSAAAEYTARILLRPMMSSMHKLWESVIQGQHNKAANRDSKYITAHFSPPELNWQRWICESGPGPSGNNSAHSTLEWGETGQLHRGSQDTNSQTSAACCMTRVGTEWELAYCLAVCVYVWTCVCV